MKRYIRSTTSNTRLVALSDGTGMGGTLCVFRTDAPKDFLKKLEDTSCQAFISGNGYDDVPQWGSEVEKAGYTWEYVGEHGHVTPYGTSRGWLELQYPECKEQYVIDDQPDI